MSLRKKNQKQTLQKTVDLLLPYFYECRSIHYVKIGAVVGTKHPEFRQRCVILNYLVGLIFILVEEIILKLVVDHIL